MSPTTSNGLPLFSATREKKSTLRLTLGLKTPTVFAVGVVETKTPSPLAAAMRRHHTSQEKSFLAGGDCRSGSPISVPKTPPHLRQVFISCGMGLSPRVSQTLLCAEKRNGIAAISTCTAGTVTAGAQAKLDTMSPVRSS